MIRQHEPCVTVRVNIQVRLKHFVFLSFLSSVELELRKTRNNLLLTQFPFCFNPQQFLLNLCLIHHLVKWKSLYYLFLQSLCPDWFTVSEKRYLSDQVLVLHHPQLSAYSLGDPFSSHQVANQHRSRTDIHWGDQQYQLYEASSRIFMNRGPDFTF